MLKTDKKLILESCVDSFEDAKIAEINGASRIELCSALEYDGLSPSYTLAKKCVDELSIPIMVMIRPRKGNFVYSEAEVTTMIKSISDFKKIGIAGFVFGLLNTNNEIDFDNLKLLVEAANPFQVTFHKAIDYTPNVYKSFETLNKIEGITRVLTSGGATTAWEGRFELKQMNELPNRRIEIIAAGKIFPENRNRIAEFTGINELHGKRIV